MRAIITGASGFIGAALCRELLSCGWRVTAVVRPGSKNISKIPDGVEKLIIPLDKLYYVEAQFDVFFHMAWNGAIGDARENFDKQNKNLALTGIALRSAKKFGCKRFIGAGSQAEYGVVRGICNEQRTPWPFMMYGAAKLACYYMGSLLARQLELEFVWPRIYSVYGQGENSETLISYLVSSLHKGETPKLTVCDNMWDFLYVTDCARALRLLGEKKLNENSCIFNVSYGAPRKLREFVEMTRDIISPSADLDFGSRVADKERTFWLEPDITLLRTSTGFEPEVDFDEGIEKTGKWMKTNVKY